MEQPVIVSGIQPSGRLHLGNYFGALKNFKELAASGKYACFFFVADYHSITVAHDPKERRQEILDLMKGILAAEISPKSTFFIQSRVSEHTELAWIFDSLTPLGELNRMTQFKEKGEKHGENAGLFTYPVLQAADILLYDGRVVPIGEDQLQHLELTRTIARKFNNQFGEFFNEPQPLLTEVPRLMSLDDPLKKMSKSSPSGCVFLDDPPELIREKFMKAVTDSGNEVKYNLEQKPGISNLLRILSQVTGKSIELLEREFSEANYSAFKSAVGDAVAAYLLPYQRRLASLSDHAAEKIFSKGSRYAKKIASTRMATVRERIGLA